MAPTNATPSLTDKLAALVMGSSSSASTSSSHLLAMPEQITLSSDVSSALKDLEQQFDQDRDLLLKTTDQMLWEYKTGLSRHGTDEDRDTFLPMIPSYVHNVPDGTETGTFLALDLGGTNLRVCEVKLLGNSKFSMRQQKFKVSDEQKTGTAAALFDFIAQCVADFVSTLDSTKSGSQEPLYLGFTFSFPVEQTALDRGTLINWTKGFTASGAVGEDVMQLLQDAFDRKNVSVKCAAIVNDTVGTLLSRAYQAGAAVVGAIFGTGTNGAYLEKMSAITKALPTKVDFDYMVINTEWGAFDNERVVLRVTPHDNKCDRESVNPRKHQYEKMISGMYIGEVVRNVLLHLIDHNLLFKGYSSAVLNTHYGLDTALMSAIEAHPANAYTEGVSSASLQDEWQRSISETKKVLIEQLGVEEAHITPEDCAIVRRVSEIVGTRGARLAAVAVAATLIQTGYDKKDPATGAYKDFEVGVDGSLVEFYPGYEVRIRQALREILGDEMEKSIKIGLAKDGSGIGAALTALQAYKQVQSSPADATGLQKQA